MCGGYYRLSNAMERAVDGEAIMNAVVPEVWNDRRMDGWRCSSGVMGVVFAAWRGDAGVGQWREEWEGTMLTSSWVASCGRGGFVVFLVRVLSGCWDEREIVSHQVLAASEK